jgi:DNA adenine methylase
MRDASPLRYPGGKWRIAPFFERVMDLNRLTRPRYLEPYAGGASLALTLLIRERVSEIHLNDLDPSIHAFWHSVLQYNKDFLDLVRTTPVTVEERAKQKTIYSEGIKAGKLALGFATFFLNRTNHSGILNGGMIGGNNQTGEWKLDARFNRIELTRRIERIGKLKSRIHISSKDALDFLRNQSQSKRRLIYLDPPYYRAGRRLYLNSYDPEDHSSVSQYVVNLNCPWIVSYDDVREIRRLYQGVKSRNLQLLHTARSLRSGREVLFFSECLRIPRTIIAKSRLAQTEETDIVPLEKSRVD